MYFITEGNFLIVADAELVNGRHKQTRVNGIKRYNSDYTRGGPGLKTNATGK